MKQRFLWVFVCLIILIPCAHAQIKESKDWLVGTKEHNLLTRLSDSFDFPNTEMPTGQAVATVTVEGPNLTILIVGPPKGDSKAYASALDQWREQSHLSGEVTYSQEDDCAAAKLRVEEGGFGKMEANLSFDLGGFTRDFEHVETKTSIALVAPNWTNLNVAAKPDYIARNGNRIWNISKSGVSGTITSTLKVPTWIVPAFIAWLTLPIVGFIVCFGIGFAVAKDQRRPIAQRRKIYAMFVGKGTFIVLGIHALLVVATLPTRALDPVSQLWFGLRFSQIGIFVVPLFGFIPVLLLSPINKLETKLLGATEQEKAEREDFSEYAAPQLQSAVEPPKSFLAKYWRLGFMALCLAIALIPLSKDNAFRPFQRLFFPLFLLVNFLGPSSQLKRVKQMSQAYADLPQNAPFRDRVETRGKMIAQRVGVPLPPVMIGTLLQGPYGALINQQKLTVTPAMADRFSDGELDFVIAHELAHLKENHVAKKKAMIFGPLLLFTALFAIILAGKSISFNISPAYTFSPFILILVLGYPYRHWISSTSKKFEYIADEMAVRITRDKDSAISALTKMTRQDGLPGFDEVDFLASHPTIAKRIERIRAIVL